MSENLQNDDIEAEGQDEQMKPPTKKRTRDLIEGETITPDTFKKAILNADSFVSDSNKSTFIRLGTQLNV